MAQESYNEKLLRKVAAGSSGEIKKALRQGADVNYVSEDGNFALKLAAKDDMYYLVAKLLLEKGADANLVNEYEESALMEACMSGCFKLVRLLLLNGAHVDARDNLQRTALMWLCADTKMPEPKFLELAKLLLNHGADSNLQDTRGESSLMIACIGNNYLAVDFLIRHGINVNLLDKRGQSALMFACENSNAKIAEQLLINGAQVDLQDKEGKTALMRVCEKRKQNVVGPGIVELLLNKGAKIDLQDNTGETALMKTCKSGDEEIAKLLLNSGAKVNLRDQEGKTALMKASKEGNLDIVQLLLNKGAHLDVQDEEGKTALMMVQDLYADWPGIGAVTVSHPRNRLLYDQFVKAHRNFNLQDNEGRTSLMRFCEAGDVEHLRHISHSTETLSVDLQDKDGKTALMIACLANQKKATEIILDFRPKVNLADNKGKTALMFACQVKNEKLSELLFTFGAKVNMQDNEGKTAMMLASETGAKECVEFLSRVGADVNWQDHEGITALMLAVSRSYPDIAELLLRYGAKVDMQDSEGKTALIRAFEVSSLSEECGQLLLNSIQLSSDEGRSLLMRACKEGREKWVKIVLKSGAADVNMKDDDGRTLLMDACVHVGLCEGYDEDQCAIELLLNNGAQVDMQDNEGKTALMLLYDNYNIIPLVEYDDDDVPPQSITNLLLECHQNFNLQDHEGRNILMRCCGENVIQLLVNSGANIDLQDEEGKTALMFACECYRLLNNSGPARVLINSGAQVDLQDNEGTTALMLACQSGNEECVKLLMKAGTEINLQDNKGRTALMLACHKMGEYMKLHLPQPLPAGSGKARLLRNCIRTLLHNRADVNLQDCEGKTALMRISREYETARSLINSGAKVDIKDNCGVTTLMRACEKGNVEYASLLLNSGANPDLQNDRGQTALMMSIFSRETDITKLLLSSDARVHVQDNDGVTALMLACQSGNEECAELLVKSRTGMDLQDKEGRTALVRACKVGKVNIVKLILDNAAQVNLQDHTGGTALMIACRFGWASVIELLLKFEANVNLQDNSGETALTKAIKIGLTNVIVLLLESGAYFDLQEDEELTTLPRALEGRSTTEVAKMLIKTGIKSSAHPRLMYNGTEIMEVESEIEDQPPPLIVASVLGNKDTVKQLLSEGAEIDSKDSKGRTALITASGNGHNTVTDILLERGAHIDSQDDKGYSALMAACQNGHVETTSRLLDEDADTFLKNSEGKTAFGLAIQNNKTKLLPLFTKLRRKSSYPGISFLEGAKRETVTMKEKTIDLKEVGLSLSIPEDALPSTDPPLQLKIQPCFSGSFDIPRDVELVSPAYIIKPSRKVAFQKEVLVKMWHHANLETEKDCEDMVFLSASTRPQYKDGNPVYIFKKVRVKGSFRPGEEQPVGQIALKHFCTLALGKRKREDGDTVNQETDQKRNKGNLYSARLYKAIENKVIFCICLYHPKYTKNCNEVMAAQYGAPDRKAGPIRCYNGVKLTSNSVSLTKTCTEGWDIVFKKNPATILKDEISVQEMYEEISDLLELDYPPRIEIAIQNVPTSPETGALCLHVQGLNTESIFELLPGDITKQITLDTSRIKSAVSDLKEEIQEQSKTSTSTTPALLPTASEMATIMEKIEQLLQCSDHTDSVVRLMLDEVERKSCQLNQEVSAVLRHVKINYGMDIYVERTNTFAVQMKTIYMANMTHRNSPDWQYAVGLFVANAANLVQAIKDTLRASKSALTLPHNYSPETSLPQFPTNVQDSAQLCATVHVAQPLQAPSGVVPSAQSPLNLGGTDSVQTATSRGHHISPISPVQCKNHGPGFFQHGSKNILSAATHVTHCCKYFSNHGLSPTLTTPPPITSFTNYCHFKPAAPHQRTHG